MEKQPTAELSKDEFRQSLKNQFKDTAVLSGETKESATNISIDTSQASLRTRLAEVEGEILNEKDKSGKYLSTGEIKSQHGLSHIVKTVEHDTSIGNIEWDKNKYKDSIQQPEVDEKDTRNFFNQVRDWVKSNNIQSLNGNVLDYLMQNPEQIPEEWQDKGVVFFGTIYNDYEDDFADCLQFRTSEQGGKTVKRWEKVQFTQRSGNSYKPEDKNRVYVAIQNQD